MSKEISDKVVLVVDDEELVRDSVQQLLSGVDGLTCITACCCDEGMTIVENQHVDLVVSDFNMPGGRGLTLLQRVKEKTECMPVFIFSGSVIASDEAHALRMGADMVLHKPEDMRKLYDMVRDLLKV